MDTTVYIRSDAFILVPVLIFIGMFLKQTPQIPAWSHVWIELIFAVVACLLHYGFNIEAVVQGILVTGTALISKDIVQNTIGGMSGKKNNTKHEE